MNDRKSDIGLLRFLTAYPVAAFAAGGLLAGLLLSFQPSAARMVFFLIAAGGGVLLGWSTLRSMLGGRFDVDTVAALAIFGSVALGEFAAGALVVLMQSGGEALEDYGLRRANRSLDNLLRRAPSVARLQTPDGFVDVAASAVTVGDLVLARPGDIVAADGVVADGCGNADEAALTGEPVPLPKRPGDRVYSGTINLSGTLLVRATKTAAHSKYELIVRMVQQAQGERARELLLPIPPAAEVQETPGVGLRGRVGGRIVAIGAGRYLESIGIRPGEDDRPRREAFCTAGKTVAFFALDGVVAGLLVFEDRVRPEAPALLRRLGSLGVHRVVMLTGDTTATAGAVARQIGIKEARSRLQPEEKVEAVRELARSGAVMMVGDGINDAPALACASVGVAMGGHGAGIATDAAHMVITVDNVERVADAIEVGRRMMRVAKQGIFFGIAASVCLMVVAGVGFIPPVAGALLQEAVDLFTILNALRARG